MKFGILFALVCVCPVAFSHERYVVIPLSALKDGKLDVNSDQMLFDVNPLQVYTGGAGSSTSTGTTGRNHGSRSGVSTGIRRTNSAGGSIQNLSGRRASLERNSGATSTTSMQRIASSNLKGSGINISPTHAVTYPQSTIGNPIVGNVRYVNTLTPSYTSNYVNALYQPSISSAMAYQPLGTVNGQSGYFVQNPSYLLNTAIRRQQVNPGYIAWPRYNAYIL